MSWITNIILISSILILLMLVYIRFQEYKKKEKYQPKEEGKEGDEEKKKIIPVWEKPEMINIPSDWIYEILANFNLRELNKFYTISKDKKKEVDRFIKIFYNLDGGLAELNKMIKIKIPNTKRYSRNLLKLEQYAKKSVYNQRLVNLFLEDRFGVNNIANFPNVAIEYTGDSNMRTPEENTMRRRATDLILETLEKIYKALGAKFVKLTEKASGEKVLLVNYTNLLPEVYSYFDEDIDRKEIDSKAPFVANLNIVGFLTWLRDPTDQKALENWSKIAPILEDFRTKVVEFSKLDQVLLDTERDLALFRINPYINPKENIPFYFMRMGRGFLGIYPNVDDIYEEFLNIGLKK